jgi:hypothetical protein
MPSQSELRPPASVDAVICRDALGDAGASEASQEQACRTCCARSPFPLSAVYEQHCLCGQVLDRSGPSACPGTFFTQEPCTACCTKAGFEFALGPGGDVASCSCREKYDSHICGTVPAAGCQLCCLNQGYLSFESSVLDASVCRCVDR